MKTLLQSIAILILGSTVELSAAIANVQVVSTTATQALIQYTWLPASDVCKVESSVSPTYSPLDHDVDTALFANSNLDSRSGATNNKGDRQFVVGTRSAPTALDGTFVSRALQAATHHFFRITCPSAGSTTATGTFDTTTIPYGSLYQDPPGSGNNQYPTIPVNQRNFGLPATSGALFSAFQTGGALAHNFMQATSNSFTHPGTGSFTVITFVKQNSRTSLNVLVGDVDQQLNPSNSGYLLFYANGPDTYSFYTVDSGGTGREVDGTSHPVLGNWACVAGIHDATVPTATVNSIWVNGVMESSNAAGSGIINTASEFGVMGAPNPPSGAWSLDGSLAMTMKISAKLTSTQINAICNSGNGQNSSDLAAYLTAQSLPGADFLYEYTPTVTADASGNGTTLTIVGTVSQGTGPSTIPGTSVPIIDPSTGLGWVSQPVLPSDTTGGALTGVASAITWTDPDTTSWNNPTFITSGTAPGATSNSGTTGKLIGHYALQLPGGVFFSTDNNPYSGSNPINSLLYQTVTVTALVSSGGSAPGQTINVCAFNNTQTGCDASSQIYQWVLPTTSTSKTFGTGANGDMMRTTFSVGIPVWVNQAANGINIAIWKANASADIVTISSVSVGWSFGSQPGGNDGGGYTNFSTTLVNGPDCVGGTCEQGYVFTITPLQFFIGKNTGRTHFEGSVNPRDCGPALNTYYSANPLVFYCMDVNTGALYQMTQTPVNGTNPWNDYPSGGSFSVGNSFQNALCGSAPCIAKVTLTSSIPTLVQNFTAATLSKTPLAFDPTVFTEFIQVGTNATSGEFLAAFLIPGSQFGQLWWAVVIDPATTSNASGGTTGGAAGNNGCIGGGVPGCIVAATPVWAVDGAQWATWKGLETFKGDPGGERWATLITYFATASLYAVQMVDGITNGDGSINQLTTSAHSTCASPPAPLPGYGCDQITIQTNIPAPQGSGAFAYAPNSPLLVNSLLNLTPGDGQGAPDEVMRVLSVTPSNTSGAWKVLIERGADNHSLQPSGSLPKIYLQPAMNQAQETNPAPGGQAFWNYGNYPYGVDLSGNRQAMPVMSYLTGCHTDFTNGGAIFGCPADQDHRASSGAVTGMSNNVPVRPQLALPLAPSITNGQATFNNDSNPVGGYHQSHFAASYNAPVFGPGTPYLGFFNTNGAVPPALPPQPANVCVSVRTNLCKFAAANPPPGLSLPYSKISPLAGYYGHTRLTNISGPGSAVDSTLAHGLQLCIVSVAGECDSGSTLNDVFIAAPILGSGAGPGYFNYDYLPAQDAINADNITLVVRNTSNWFSGTQEVKFPNVSDSSGFRTLTHGQHLTFQSVFDNSQFTPDGKFVVVQMPQVGDGSAQNAWLVGKVPPEQTDNINRSTWWKQTIPVPAVAGATSAYIRAGYAEFGNPASGQFFASERQENSVFTTGTTTTLGSGAVPFFYETTESGSWSATSCTSGCSIQLNIIPQRMMYGQIVWKNGGTTIKTGPVFVVPSP